MTIDGGKGNDYSYNYAAKVTIDGGAGNDYIGNGYADNVSISGGAGNDYLRNWARTEWNSDTDTDETLETGDNVTLNGGTGNDYIYNGAGVNVVFQYKTGDGDDTIEGFNETSALAVTGAKYSTKKNGDNVIVTVDKGKITLQGAANLETVNIDFSKLLTVTDKTSSPMTVAADVKVINASTRTKAVKITGNKLDNEIYGGSKNDSIRGGKGADKIYGGSGNDKLYGDAGNDILLGGKGNDSLWGGVGNDSLWGDAGNDTFIYTVNEGTDKIFDYADGDMLKILNADGSDGYFKSSKYSGGDLTLSINGGGKIIFDDVASTTKFNINGSSYNISGSKLIKK